MREKKLKKTANITLRVPDELLAELDAVSNATGFSRNEIVERCCEDALPEMRNALSEERQNKIAELQAKTKPAVGRARVGHSTKS